MTKPIKLLKELIVPWGEPVHEDDLLCIYEHNEPETRVHLVYVPKTDKMDHLTYTFIMAHMDATKIIENTENPATAYSIHQHIGSDAGAEIDYPHIHVVVRTPEEADEYEPIKPATIH